MDKLSQTILLVEDDLAIREALELYLEGLSLAYVTADDGLLAVEVLQRQKIDLIITDFRMPRLDGIGLLNWCRKNGYHSPVIFISADAPSIDREKIALQDCCASLIKKPIDLDLFDQALKASLAREHHKNCVHQI